MNSLALAPEPEASEKGATPQSYLSAVIPPLDGELLYAFDPQLHPELGLGSVLTLPLGRRLATGFVVSVDSDRERLALSDMQRRSIQVKAVPRDAKVYPAFSVEHLPFFQWIASYYAEPLSRILELAIPNPTPGRKDPVIRLCARQLPSQLGPSQRRLIEHLSSRAPHETDPFWIPFSRLKHECPTSPATIRALVAKGILEQLDEMPQMPSAPRSLTAASAIESLNSEQQAAASALSHSVKEGQFQPFLLHGVTGSGKTEVYLEAIIETLRTGKSAIVLVPEIALTPQLLGRFEARLGEPIAVLHSSLTPRERWHHWSSLLRGDRRVAIGARSALFAPVKDLGLIVVDEEHDPSYKQGEGIRYNARDLAIVRAKLSQCPVILGSATPSLESLHNAHSGRYTCFTLQHRYFSSPPTHHEIVDLNRVKPWEMRSTNISPLLHKELRDALARGEQSFVLYNRRGFATYLQCRKCSHSLGCPHCSVTLTFHRDQNSLLCHLCGFSSVTPVMCPACGAVEGADNSPPSKSGKEQQPLFALRGAGTERVFEELTTLFPTARIAKLDRDTATSLDDFTEILRRVRNHEVDILVGTQMIAKGHDIPNVTLVGVVDCDVGLHMPDFRAGERVFQLLTQVAGRAGRREKRGTVILQTRVPQHASLQKTAAADFTAFAEQELAMRRALEYPPFSRLLRIVVLSESRQVAQNTSHDLARIVKPLCAHHSIVMLGPTAAPLEKVRNSWRYHLLFKSKSGSHLQHLMLQAKKLNLANKEVRFVFDIDPQDML